jgi:hypothetical protein
MRLTRRQRWIEAGIAAAAAGCAALAVQDEHAGWRRQLIAFLAAALPVLAVSQRHAQALPKVVK